MGLISRVSSRTYRSLERAAKMFLSATRSALGASLARQAGYTTYRTTMVEAVARAGRDHNDVKVIYGFCALGSGLLFGIFYHSAEDPRYFFGTNRSNENYKKYMTKRQWCMENGRGLRFREASNINANCRGFTDWMRTDRYFGLKLDWQKDVYQLILDVHNSDPKDYVSPKPE